MSEKQYLDSFLRYLKVLVIDLAKRYPNDPQVDRVKKRALTAISVDPHMVITTVGKHLYTYQEKIYNCDEDAETFFMENNFDRELVESGDKVDLISYIIPKVKECARGLPKNEKEAYKQYIVSMLDDYLEYIFIIKTQK